MYNNYQYKISSIKLSVGTDIYDIEPNRFQSLVIDHQYMTFTVPYILLTMSLSFVIINKIFANQNKVKIMLDIMEIELDKDKQVISKTSFIKKSFEADLNRDKGTTLQDKHASDKDKTTQRVDSESPAEFILYTTSDINLFKIENDFILKNTNPGTALTKFLISRGITKGVIASTPKIKTVSDIVIPIGDLMSNISFLSHYYGLYGEMPLVYKDIENMYVIDSNDVPLSVGTNKGIVKFVPNTAGGIVDGAMDKNTDKSAYLVSWNTTSVITPNVNMNHVRMAEGANVISVTPKGAVKKENVFKDIAKTKVIRSYHALSAKSALNPSQLYVSYNVTVNDAPLSIFKPYMKYIFNQDKKIMECSVYSMQLSLRTSSTDTQGLAIKSMVEFSLQPIEK